MEAGKKRKRVGKIKIKNKEGKYVRRFSSEIKIMES